MCLVAVGYAGLCAAHASQNLNGRLSFRTRLYLNKLIGSLEENSYRKKMRRSLVDTIDRSIINVLRRDYFHSNELYQKVKEDLDADNGWPVAREIYESHLNGLIDSDVVRMSDRICYLEHQFK